MAAAQVDLADCDDNLKGFGHWVAMRWRLAAVGRAALVLTQCCLRKAITYKEMHFR